MINTHDREIKAINQGMNQPRNFYKRERRKKEPSSIIAAFTKKKKQNKKHQRKKIKNLKNENQIEKYNI